MNIAIMIVCYLIAVQALYVFLQSVFNRAAACRPSFLERKLIEIGREEAIRQAIEANEIYLAQLRECRKQEIEAAYQRARTTGFVTPMSREYHD